MDWDAVDWRACEENVRRLQQRIFAASQAQDLKRVRNLQKLMLRSRANALVSVRRVSERNAGRLTAGIDGEVALTSSAKTSREHTTRPTCGASLTPSPTRVLPFGHDSVRAVDVGADQVFEDA